MRRCCDALDSLIPRTVARSPEHSSVGRQTARPGRRTQRPKPAWRARQPLPPDGRRCSLAARPRRSFHAYLLTVHLHNCITTTLYRGRSMATIDRIGHNAAAVRHEILPHEARSIHAEICRPSPQPGTATILVASSVNAGLCFAGACSVRHAWDRDHPARLVRHAQDQASRRRPSTCRRSPAEPTGCTDSSVQAPFTWHRHTVQT
jgi:hypothetical protein